MKEKLQNSQIMSDIETDYKSNRVRERDLGYERKIQTIGKLDYE